MRDVCFSFQCTGCFRTRRYRARFCVCLCRARERGDYWLECVLEHIYVFVSEERTERIRHADKTTGSRKHREHDQRNRHEPRRLVRCDWSMMSIVLDAVCVSKALLTSERHYHHARHVKRGQKRGQCTDGPKQFAERRRWKTERRRAPNPPENLVLGEEAGKDRNAGDCQPASQHRYERDGHVLPERAHASHVLLVMHAVDDRSGTEEEQRLEERVRDHVEDRGDKRADTTRQKHVTEL